MNVVETIFIGGGLMDFCISDAVEEERKLSDTSFFMRNMISFVDFKTFEEKYLTSYEYNDPGLRNYGFFTLQPRGYTSSLDCLEDSEKLR